ncbi:hypothetical protein [uncultured Aquimarina sp.]|uniref:hypothetical protein n=1 Tax=uncultured Aquimarina sp. TaxID=575652 RepID=UPI0026125A20|nr:hypothetical protein [uncultured Aquimarina sp.]
MRKQNTEHFKISYKSILTSFICSFILSLNSLFAQGPNAPEAAAFEPVDATDMVNLLTGDLTYVIPILNVPSPEGGYPLALSYHAGIAMDQEASWVGLGWSLNPGAINRGVNGYPDDWKNGLIQESFYDVGGSETTHSIGSTYTTIAGGWTFGHTSSYNSNKGFGGSVSIGYGIPDGAGGIIGAGATAGIRPGGQFYGSANVGYTSSFGISTGINVGTSGVGVNAGYNWGNNQISVGYNSSYEGENSLSITYGKGESFKKSGVGVNFSSRGISVNGKLGGIGIGSNISFMNSINMNDYNVEQDNESYSLMVGTPIGIFSLGYNKQKVEWYLNSHKSSNVSGALYFGDAIKYECEVEYIFNTYYGQPRRYKSIAYVDSPDECSCSNLQGSSSLFICTDTNLVSSSPTNGGKYFMDVNEVGVTNGSRELNKNNAMFPAFDSFNVSAQGLSGSMTPRISRTGTLLGLHRNFANSNLFEVNYNLSSYSGFHNNNSQNKPEVNFYFNNQYSSSLNIEPASFNTNISHSDIYDHYNTSSGTMSSSRKKDGRFVSYYTLEQIKDGTAASDGLLLPYEYDVENATNGVGVYDGMFNTGEYSDSAIGGFKIVAPDGKTYHYSLPVFNLNTNIRTIGAVQNKPERESYFEVRQGAYATHWLLTAITGPDYVNTQPNTRNFPDGKDMGYWVRFDYGKWTNNSVWKLPYAEEYSISEDNPNVKTKTYGKKQLYYLDRIKTRTHSAIFVKNTRVDYTSPNWERHVFQANGAQPTSQFFDEIRFNIPEQKSLKLEKIILVKNEDDLINKTLGNSLPSTGTIFNSITEESIPDYNLQDNIIDVGDNISETIDNAIKIIDFAPHYSYDLAKGSPNSLNGRLTLNGLSIKGKKGNQLIPPYKFKYSNNVNFDYDKKDLWGYYENGPETWSLNKIITPTGGTIDINYESDDYDIAVAETGRIFNKHLKFTFFPDELPLVNGTPTKIKLKIEVDDQDSSTSNFLLSDYFNPNKKIHVDIWFSTISMNIASPTQRLIPSIDIKPQKASIVSMNTSDNSMIIEVEAIGKLNYNSNTLAKILDAVPVSSVTGSNNYTENQKKPRPLTASNSTRAYSLIHNIISNKRPEGNVGGGLRVKELSILDGVKVYKTQYLYNKPNSAENPNNSDYTSSGVISYLPFPSTSDQPFSYGSELPTPTPMYEYVTVKSGVNSTTNSFINKTTYKFKVLEEKQQDKIKFGDLFEISEQTNLNNYNNNIQKNVNIKSYELIDNFACLGQILEINHFNNKEQLLSKTINEYASSNEISQGIIKESFQSYKDINYRSSDIQDEWLINTSTRIIYPSLLKSTTTITNGYTSTTNFIRHDNISGQLLETQTKSSTGLEFKTKIVPAYHIDKYSNNVEGYSMGAKVNNPTNKNMLSQTAVTLTQIKNNTGDWATINANISTWNNNWTYQNYDGSTSTPTNNAEKIWRKHQSFVWKGEVDVDGVYIGYTGEDDNFNWFNPDNQNNIEWIKTSEVSLYDHYSMPLESIDINDNKVSTKMGDDESKVFAVANAGYNQMFYSGAEDLVENTNYFSGQVSKGNTATLSDTYHTGAKGVQAAANVKAFAVNPEAGKYKISVWVYKGANNNYVNTKVKAANAVISYHSGEVIPAGDWVQLNFYTQDIGNAQEVYVYNTSGTTIYDDFRMVPFTSSMTSYVYNDWDELTYIIGANNMATKYEYDDAGRLHKTYSEVMDTPGIPGGFKLNSEINYNYSTPINTNVTNPNALTLSIGVSNYNISSPTLTATANGGTFEYEYRWAIGNNPNTLSYGSWSSSNTRNIFTECGPNGRVHYKCQVRDKNTGDTKETIGNHQKQGCGDDDDDPNDPDGNPIQQ